MNAALQAGGPPRQGEFPAIVGEALSAERQIGKNRALRDAVLPYQRMAHRERYTAKVTAPVRET